MARVTKVFPVLAVGDLEEALSFCKDRLAFKIAWTWGSPISRAGLTLDDIAIQVEAVGLGAPPGPSVLYFHMTGVAEYYEDCRRRGATISMELGARP